MSSAAYVPDRGDLIWLEFTPHAGHEQSGRRPAIVLSPRSYNSAAGLALVCPITSQAKGYPFEVALPPSGAIQGVVLADQVRSLDWRIRRARRIAAAPSPVVEAVRSKIKALLD